MRYFAIVWAVLFAVFVALQYNDPDPVQWMAIYGAAMGVCIAFALGKPLRFTGFAIAIVAVLWASTLFPDFWGKVRPAQMVETMKAEKPEIEESREAGGLLIVAAVTVILGSVPSKRKS